MDSSESENVPKDMGPAAPSWLFGALIVGLFLAAILISASGPLLCEAGPYAAAQDTAWCWEFWLNRYQTFLSAAAAAFAAYYVWRQLRAMEEQVLQSQTRSTAERISHLRSQIWHLNQVKKNFDIVLTDSGRTIDDNCGYINNNSSQIIRGALNAAAQSCATAFQHLIFSVEPIADFDTLAERLDKLQNLAQEADRYMSSPNAQPNIFFQILQEIRSELSVYEKLLSSADNLRTTKIGSLQKPFLEH